MPSFIRLSPSRTVTIRRGTPSPSAIAVAATGSVGETIAPRTKASGHESPITRCATPATMTVVSATKPTERSPMGRMFALRSRKEEKNAATNKSGGRKISNTSSGASSTSGTPGIKPRTNPPRTRKIGYGTSRTSESNTRPATATSNPKTMSSKCSATANSLRSTRPCRCNRAPAASVPPRRPPPTKPRRSRVAGVAPRRPGLRAAQARRTPDAPTPRERG